MAGRKRTVAQRQEHLSQLSELRSRGYTIEELAKRLSLTKTQICYDLRKLGAKAGKDYLAEQRHRELAKIDHLEEVTWKAWEQSREEPEKKTPEKKADAAKGTSGRKGPEGPVKPPKGGVGASQFLRQISWCIDKRCQMLGLGSTSADSADTLQNMTEEELYAHANNIGMRSPKWSRSLPNATKSLSKSSGENPPDRLETSSGTS